MNDSSALAAAAIGVAMGGTGAAMAVQAADLVLLGDDLLAVGMCSYCYLMLDMLLLLSNAGHVTIDI